ncbi:MAG: hypothetical protein A2984_02870 [Omnitrophica WOR_2 bacterium RIFCSPLOWO2_01_FULL_41_12]|nr:MAG: hypothetical protein A2984_02870 [Omnitrophica WOR_2 bacterium RIFCSPLOWO2_01_FULL_41_12]
MQDDLQKARNYAFLLLKFRPRSEKEIFARLEKKKFAPEIIKETVAFLKEKKFIDDAYFTQVWIESRLKKPLGFRRLRQELKIKGIISELIDSQIEETKKNYCEEEIVSKIVRERVGRLKRLEPQKLKRRLFAYLLRRGFSPQVITDAINQIKI